jgi:hypothetical protein
MPGCPGLLSNYQFCSLKNIYTPEETSMAGPAIIEIDFVPERSWFENKIALGSDALKGNPWSHGVLR